jgi:hypothetical protein
MPDDALPAVPAVPAGAGCEPGRLAALAPLPMVAFVSTH